MATALIVMVPAIAAAMIMPAGTVTRTPHAPAKAEHEGKKRHGAKREFFHTPDMVPGYGDNMDKFC